MNFINQHFKNSRLNNFNQTTWAMLIGGFFVRITYFMSWPFLIVMLNNKLAVSPMSVGVILGVSAGIAAFSGVYIGHLSDKFGRKPIILMGCILGVLAYFGLIFTYHFWHFFIIMAILGLVRPMVEVISKVIISDSLTNKQDTEFALYIRYFLINVAGAIGPLIGLWLGLNNPTILFSITSMAYFCYFIWLFKLIKDKKSDSITQTPNFLKSLSVIRTDVLFLVLIFANFLMLNVYSQVNATLPQIISLTLLEKAAQIMVLLTVVNCLTITLFQFPLLRLLKNFTLTHRSQIGIMLILLSQILFIVIDKYSMIHWGVVMFVLSLGEAILFPTLNVHIDRFAKPELKGSYFGAGALSEIGSATGPILGAWVISAYSGNHYFGLMAVFCAICIGLYFMVGKKEK